METIKIRAWNTSRKLMIEWDEVKDSPVEIGNMLTFKNLIQMIFTGIQDKNGKELYFSDVIKIEFEATEDHSAYTQVGVVTWDKNRIIAWDKRYNLYFPVHSKCEKIGNIYENPELLK